MRHENYSFIRRKNDIALIRVSSRIEFTPTISPACLATDLSDVSDNIKLYATGWGTTDAEREWQSSLLYKKLICVRNGLIIFVVIFRPKGSAPSNILLKTQLQTMPLPECNATLLGFNENANQAALRDGISESQYCAYDPQARNDSCQGRIYNKQTCIY